VVSKTYNHGYRARIAKIVFIITRADDLGGAQVHVRDLASALRERGYDVLVLAGGGGALFDALEERGVPYRKLEKLIRPIRPLRDWSALKEIRDALQEIKPDVVTTHSNKAGLLGRLAARSLNIAVVHTSHGFLFGGQQSNATGRFYRLMEKIGARAGDKVIAVSESEFNAAKSLGVIPAEKMVVVHNGLPDVGPRFRADPACEPPVLVMVARFTGPKDHPTLLKALGGLKDYSWSLQLIGAGAEMDAAKKLAAKTGIAQRVSFLGAREDISAILAAAQVFVLSSKREGFPLSILEAMRAGLPVLASAVGGTGEAVEEEKSGLLFPPGDVKALRKRLACLLEDPALRKNMGLAGRKRFLEKFTLEQMVNKTAAVYCNIAALPGEGTDDAAKEIST